MAEKKVFITSDTHFGHTRIIQYENRPFNSINEMNKEMIKRWNAKVTNNDVVFHLGDFCFGNKEMISAIISELNGKKILVMGNHDRGHNVKYYLDCGFDEVYNYPILYKEFFIFSHEPITYLKAPFISCYGHIHGSPNYPTFTKNSVCCCVERWNYTPINFNTILLNLERLQRQMETALNTYKPIELQEEK